MEEYTPMDPTRLDNVDVLPPHTLSYLHVSFPIGKLLCLHVGLVDTESVTDLLSEVLVRVAREHFNVWHSGGRVVTKLTGLE